MFCSNVRLPLICHFRKSMTFRQTANHQRFETAGNVYLEVINWAPSSEFVSSSIPSWQIPTAHAQPFRGARDLALCLKVPLDSLLVWASSGGSGETARMRRLAWTFAARIGDKYQVRLTRPKYVGQMKKQWSGTYTIEFHIKILPLRHQTGKEHKWAASWQNHQCGCASSEDSDQPGHPPSLIRVFAVRIKKAWVLSYPLIAQRRLWSDWTDAQADLSLRWAHTHFVGFVTRRLKYQQRHQE